MMRLKIGQNLIMDCLFLLTLGIVGISDKILSLGSLKLLIPVKFTLTFLLF